MDYFNRIMGGSGSKTGAVAKQRSVGRRAKAMSQLRTNRGAGSGGESPRGRQGIMSKIKTARTKMKAK